MGNDNPLLKLPAAQKLLALPVDQRRVIDKGADGRPLTKTAQVRMCGNSVCPPPAQAIVGANFSDFASVRRVA